MFGAKLKHGVFMAPYHPVDENPTLCIQRDLELMEHLDRLGFHEAWIGEHHSSGFEVIASPELFIAAAAERTRHIRLGTGVVSLPYHNPLMVANRMIQLDHQTQGRIMIGVGPGLLVSDAMMMDIEPKDQRDRMMQALDVILRLLRGEEVTETTEWYRLNKAKVHLLPYQYPHPEVAVASAVTPSGGRAAGTYDLGMLCVAATETTGFDALAQNWAVANEFAARQGRVMDPARLRLVCPVHIAETREEARDNIRAGLRKWLDYYNLVAPKGLMGVAGEDAVDILLKSNRAVVGTPDDAVEMIERLHRKQGDFGVFLQQAHNWADWDKTKKSYELYARFVMPRLQDSNRHRVQSMDWMRQEFDNFNAQRQKGVDAMFAKHAAETVDKAS